MVGADSGRDIDRVVRTMMERPVIEADAENLADVVDERDKRISNLEAQISTLTADLESVGLMVIPDGDTKLSVAIRPGCAEKLRAAFKL